MTNFDTRIKGCQARSQCRRGIALYYHPIRFFLGENRLDIQEHPSGDIKKILVCLDDI